MMILDEVNKSRQLMMKSSANTVRARAGPDAIGCTDQASLNLLAQLEQQQCPTVFVPLNGTFQNPILPVFPRVPLLAQSPSNPTQPGPLPPPPPAPASPSLAPTTPEEAPGPSA